MFAAWTAQIASSHGAIAARKPVLKEFKNADWQRVEEFCEICPSVLFKK